MLTDYHARYYADERLFGDLPSFRTQYINNGGNLAALRDRLHSFCWRSLRSQVIEYVRHLKVYSFLDTMQAIDLGKDQRRD